MSPRTLTLIPIVIAATILGLTTFLLLKGGGDDDTSSGTAVADPLVAALAYVPSDAPFVAVAETDATSGPLAALSGVADRIPGSELALNAVGGQLGDLDLRAELLPTLGNPIVASVPELPGGDAATTAVRPLPFRIPKLTGLLRASRFATVARDPAALRDLLDRQVDGGTLQREAESRGFTIYARPGGGGYALKGPLLVGAGSRQDLAAALTLGARASSGGDAAGEADEVRSGSLTTGTLRDRFRGLPSRARSAIRASLDLEVLQRGDASDVEIPWVSALRRASFAVVPSEDAVDVPFRLETDPEVVTEGDVPIATGPAAPSPAAADDARVVVGIRDAAHSIEFVRRTLRVTDSKTAQQIDSIETNLRRFARVDPTTQIIAKLTGTTTVTTDLNGTITVRAELTDPETVGNALSQLQRISTLSSLAGGIGVDVDTRGITFEAEPDGRYRIEQDGKAVARVAVINDALVASNREDVDLQALADAFPESPENEGGGALSVRVASEAVVDTLVKQLGLPGIARSALAAIGDLTLRARGANTAVTGSVRVAIAG